MMKKKEFGLSGFWFAPFFSFFLLRPEAGFFPRKGILPAKAAE